jgi:hypothetical protein
LRWIKTLFPSIQLSSSWLNHSRGTLRGRYLETVANRGRPQDFNKHLRLAAAGSLKIVRGFPMIGAQAGLGSDVSGGGRS